VGTIPVPGLAARGKFGATTERVLRNLPGRCSMINP
jgi:hypothetical protein